MADAHGQAGATESTVTRTYQALWAQEHPATGAAPPGADPLGPALRALTRHLQYLTAEGMASDGAPQSAGSAPTVAALAQRIRYVRALLLRLVRIDPSYAARLAPELQALHRLLSELVRGAAAAGAARYPAPSGGGALAPAGPVTVPQPFDQLAARGVPAPTTYLPSPAASPYADSSPAAAASPSAHAAGAAASTPRSASPSSAPEPPRLLMNLVVSTGPSRSVSAASGSTGTSAGTLVTMCALCLCVGILFGRLTLIVLPWRLAVLGHRLERPG